MNREKLNITLPKELIRKLKDFSDRTGTPISRKIEKVLDKDKEIQKSD